MTQEEAFTAVMDVIEQGKTYIREEARIGQRLQ
jgi:hypothetical protein